MHRSDLFWLMALLVAVGTVPTGQQLGPATGSLVIAGEPYETRQSSRSLSTSPVGPTRRSW